MGVTYVCAPVGLLCLLEGFIHSKVKVDEGVMRRIVWRILCGVDSWRRMIIYRWICRAEYYYLTHQRIGLCLSFEDTRPFLLPSSCSTSDVIEEFTRSHLTFMFEPRSWTPVDYRCKPYVHKAELKRVYWWPLADRTTRFRVLDYLKSCYRYE